MTYPARDAGIQLPQETFLAWCLTMLKEGTKDARTCSESAEQACVNSGPIVDSKEL